MPRRVPLRWESISSIYGDFDCDFDCVLIALNSANVPNDGDIHEDVVNAERAFSFPPFHVHDVADSVHRFRCDFQWNVVCGGVEVLRSLAFWSPLRRRRWWFRSRRCCFVEKQMVFDYESIRKRLRVITAVTFCALSDVLYGECSFSGQKYRDLVPPSI